MENVKMNPEAEDSGVIVGTRAIEDASMSKKKKKAKKTDEEPAVVAAETEAGTESVVKAGEEQADTGPAPKKKGKKKNADKKPAETSKAKKAKAEKSGKSSDETNKAPKDDKQTKFLLSLKKSIRKSIKKEAAEAGISMNDYIVQAVEEKFKNDTLA